MSTTPDVAQQSVASPANAQAAAALANLLHIVDWLFAECPWWRTQTHSSLASFVLEEAREVTAALLPLADFPVPGRLLPGTIAPEISSHLCSELGDLLLQVLSQAKLAELEGFFSLTDVLAQLSAKLERRHPHLFATAHASTPEEVDALYAAVKAQERT